MTETKSNLLFLYVETPLHAGTGRTLGAVDLPLQRERATSYPIIQASGVKGRLRADTRSKFTNEKEWLAIFGPENSQSGIAPDYAGALSIGDARILLFPVRSLLGVFAWVTSKDVLARFQRDARIASTSWGWDVPVDEPKGSVIWVNGNELVNGQVILEEFSFDADTDHKKFIADFAKWLVDNAIPASEEYWAKELPNKLCIVSNDAFKDFVTYSTEIQTHIALDQGKKTVKSGALWTSESLPADTLMYVPIIATDSRNKSEVNWDALKLYEEFSKGIAKLPRTHMGGDETTGQGVVALRLGGES